MSFNLTIVHSSHIDDQDVRTYINNNIGSLRDRFAAAIGSGDLKDAKAVQKLFGRQVVFLQANLKLDKELPVMKEVFALQRQIAQGVRFLQPIPTCPQQQFATRSHLETIISSMVDIRPPLRNLLGEINTLQESFLAAVRTGALEKAVEFQTKIKNTIATATFLANDDQIGTISKNEKYVIGFLKATEEDLKHHVSSLLASNQSNENAQVVEEANNGHREVTQDIPTRPAAENLQAQQVQEANQEPGWALGGVALAVLRGTAYAIGQMVRGAFNMITYPLTQFGERK